MTDVAEFIKIRQQIEALTQRIASTFGAKGAAESSKRLDEASKLLETLTAMASNDVQDLVIKRLTRQLTGLGKKAATLGSKKRVIKKQPTH